jgi:hypothetical protein
MLDRIFVYLKESSYFLKSRVPFVSLEPYFRRSSKGESHDFKREIIDKFPNCIGEKRSTLPFSFLGHSDFYYLIYVDFYVVDPSIPGQEGYNKRSNTTYLSVCFTVCFRMYSTIVRGYKMYVHK